MFILENIAKKKLIGTSLTYKFINAHVISRTPTISNDGNGVFAQF
jgi:hypothetical protein